MFRSLLKPALTGAAMVAIAVALAFAAPPRAVAESHDQSHSGHGHAEAEAETEAEAEAHGDMAAALPTKFGEDALHIVDAWARLNIAGRPSAAYFIVHNLGEDDRIVSARSSAFDRVELHTHEMKDGVMRMIELDAIAAPGGDQHTALRPGGHHLMLMAPTGPVEPGMTIPLTVVFERSGEIELELRAVGLGDASPFGDGGHGHGHHGHGHHGHGHQGHGHQGHGHHGQGDQGHSDHNHADEN